MGVSCALLGSAGTGKTTLIRNLLDAVSARSKDPSRPVLMTAMTAVAAKRLHPVLGQTFHSALAIRDGTESVETWLASLRAREDISVDVRECAGLVIDEASMMSAALLEKLDAVMRAVRAEPSKPFGGLSVLLVGDFHQLPPVATGTCTLVVALLVSLVLTCSSV